MFVPGNLQLEMMREMKDHTRVRGWGEIILILVGVTVVIGMLLGLMNTLYALPPILTTGGIGGGVGFVAAILITQRRAAIEQQKKD